MGEPFLLVLVKMAENMRPTNEDAFLCRRPVSAEPQPTRGGAGDTLESRRRCGAPRAHGTACGASSASRLARLPHRGTGSAAETGRVTSRESPKGTDGRAGAEAAWASSGGGALRAQRPRRPVPGALGGCASSVEPEKIEPGLRRKRTFTNPPNVSLEELIQIDEEDLRLLPPVGCWTRGTNRTWRGKSVSRGTTRDDQWACRLLRALVPPSPVRVRAGVGTEASGPGLCQVDRDFVEL